MIIYTFFSLKFEVPGQRELYSSEERRLCFDVLDDEGRLRELQAVLGTAGLSNSGTARARRPRDASKNLRGVAAGGA